MSTKSGGVHVLYSPLYDLYCDLCGLKAAGPHQSDSEHKTTLKVERSCKGRLKWL